jgi:hypothetical protein
MPYISDNEDTSSDEEEVVVPIEKPKATRKPRGPNKPKDVVEEIVNEVPLKEVKKPYKKKVVKEEAPEVVEQSLPVKKERKKREWTEEGKAKMLANLAKGRETRANNYKNKKDEREKLKEKIKTKIAEPIIKEVHHYHKEVKEEQEKPKPRVPKKMIKVVVPPTAQFI